MLEQGITHKEYALKLADFLDNKMLNMRKFAKRIGISLQGIYSIKSRKTVDIDIFQQRRTSLISGKVALILYALHWLREQGISINESNKKSLYNYIQSIPQELIKTANEKNKIARLVYKIEVRYGYDLPGSIKPLPLFCFNINLTNTLAILEQEMQDIIVK